MNFTHNEIGLDWIVLVENMSWQWISTVLLFQQRVTTLQPKSKKLKFYLTLQQQIWTMEWRTTQFMKSIWNLNKPKWDKGFYPLTPKNVGSSMQIIYSMWNDPELKSSKYICLEGKIIRYTFSWIVSLGTKH